MKIKSKGKVYPSHSSNGDYQRVLKLLPAAILALASVLSLEDREVLAYLITRSIKTTATAAAPNSSSSSSSSIIQRKASKKAAANGSRNGNNNNNNNNNNAHKPPVFDCDCFDCYTSYWFRWDSSPNRELIHQAIEAFEDHLTSGESEKSNKNAKAKRRDRTARRFADKNQVVAALEETEESSDAVISAAAAAAAVAETLPENNVAVAPVSSPEKVTGQVEENEVVEVSGKSIAAEEIQAATDKGLARKVLPDVLGLFNSRLWSLWSPNA